MLLHSKYTYTDNSVKLRKESESFLYDLLKIIGFLSGNKIKDEFWSTMANKMLAEKYQENNPWKVNLNMEIGKIHLSILRFMPKENPRSIEIQVESSRSQDEKYGLQWISVYLVCLESETPSKPLNFIENLVSQKPEWNKHEVRSNQYFIDDL